MKSMTDSTDNSQQAKETKGKEKKPGLIRKAAIVPIVLISISIWAFFNFFFDSLLTRTLKNSAEALYGATVDINDLRTSFYKGSIELESLAFSDKKNLQNNKIEIRDIDFSLIVSELLKKKFIVEKINVGKVQFDTKRKSPAVLIKENEAQKSSAFILKEKIKDSSTEFFSFTTDQNNLSTNGIEIDVKDIEKRINKLKEHDVTYVKRNLDEINNLYKKIKKEKNPLKKIKHAGTFSKKINETKNKIKKDKKHIENEIKTIKTKIRKIEQTSKSKINSTKNLFNKKKLEQLIIAFTKNKLDLYISPWVNKIDEYKHYLPKIQSKAPSPNKKKEVIKKTGRVIHFTKSEDLPSFLVKNLSLKAKKDRTNFQLSLKNLTNKYNSRVKNSSGKFKFVDPGSGSFNGNMMLDSTNFLFEISSMGRKVTDVWLLKNKNLNFKIKEGIESWDFKYQKKTTNVEIFHSHNFQDARVELSSSKSNKVINNILSNSAKKIDSIQLSFGHNQKARNKYLVKTTLTQDLPKALSSSINQELESIKKKANKKVKEKVNSEKRRLQKLLDEEKKKLLGKLKIKLPKLKI